MSRLLVLGNAGLDIGIDLPAVPQPGETLLGRAGPRAPGGKGLNQAVVAARAGLVPVLFYAPVGDDEAGRAIAQSLASEPFAELDLSIRPAPTDLSILMVLPGGENAIVTAGDCAHALTPDDAAAFTGRCDAGDWLLLQGNLRDSVTAAAIHAARARGGCILLNTAPVTAGMTALLPLCDVVVANASEARQLVLAGEDPVAALRAASAGIAIVTLGAEGCVVDTGLGPEPYPAPLIDTVDTTGAGDTFCGVLAAALASGRSLAAAINAAQRAAALTVTRYGVASALPTATELHDLLT